MYRYCDECKHVSPEFLYWALRKQKRVPKFIVFNIINRADLCYSFNKHGKLRSDYTDEYIIAATVKLCKLFSKYQMCSFKNGAIVRYIKLEQAILNVTRICPINPRTFGMYTFGDLFSSFLKSMPIVQFVIDTCEKSKNNISVSLKNYKHYNVSVNGEFINDKPIDTIHPLIDCTFENAEFHFTPAPIRFTQPIQNCGQESRNLFRL